MATQVNAQTSTGRNRGARKGSNQPDPKLNLGAGMSVKEQAPAIVITPQLENQEALESVKLSRKTLDQAAKIVAGFHKANDELASLKQQTEAKRGGLSDIVFSLCKVAVTDAPKPELRLAACIKVLDSAEAWERQRYQKDQKLADLPAAKVALGSSWQTYKSQILKCVRMGLNPVDFKNGTIFREAASNSGNQTRTTRAKRAARQTAGSSADAATASGILETSTTLREELRTSIIDLIKKVAALDETHQLDFANRIHRISVAAAKELKAEEEAKTEAPAEAGEQENVGTM